MVYTSNPPSWDHQVYKWLLTEVRDVHGNTITYQYTIEAGETCEGRSTHRAAYLSQILYNDGLTKVELEREGRADRYAPADPTRCPQRFQQNERLRAIQVYMQVDGQWQLVRRYDLRYNYSTYDDDPATPNKAKLTLLGVKVCGWDGASCLPETTFEYYPQGTQPGRNRLRSVSNGYGGKVTYTYAFVSELSA